MVAEFVRRRAWGRVTADNLTSFFCPLRGGATPRRWTAVFSCIGGRMYALALGIVRNRQDAEDVVSESFIKLARGIRGVPRGYERVCLRHAHRAQLRF